MMRRALKTSFHCVFNRSSYPKRERSRDPVPGSREKEPGIRAAHMKVGC